MKNLDVRKRIIDAAVEVFARRGFFEARVEDIAKAAGIAKGTVYLYFKDKPSLYAGIVDEHFNNAISMLKRTVGDKITPADKLIRIARDWTGYMLKFRGGFGMEMVGNVNLTSRIMKAIHRQAASRVEEIITLVARIVREGVAKGDFAGIEPRVGAVYFLNTVRTAFSIQMFVPGIKGGEEEIFRMMLEGFRKR